MSDEADEIVPIFALKIQELVRKSGQTQAELARRCGMGRDTFNRYFSGVTRPPAKRLIALARLFNVSPQEIDPDADEKELADAGMQPEVAEEQYKLGPPRNGDPANIRIFVDCDMSIGTAFRIIDLINNDKFAEHQDERLRSIVGDHPELGGKGRNS